MTDEDTTTIHHNQMATTHNDNTVTMHNKDMTTTHETTTMKDNITVTTHDDQLTIPHHSLWARPGKPAQMLPPFPHTIFTLVATSLNNDDSPST